MAVRHWAGLAGGGIRSAPVTAHDLERGLSALAASVADPQAGLFGPGSVMWRISRESSIFLGSAPAIMLQLAHPWVAAAIVDHSPVLTDPIGRFHRTFATMYTLARGSSDSVLRSVARQAGAPTAHCFARPFWMPCRVV